MSVFFCVLLNKMCKTNIQTGRQSDNLLFSVLPQIKQQNEPGAGLCVSAGELALWQLVGLQTLRLCPHTPHTPHAGGGGGQLLVVCIHFFPICTVFLYWYEVSAQCVYPCHDHWKLSTLKRKFLILHL